MSKNKQQKALELSLAIYRVTGLFPEGEVLVFQIRKTANQILKQLTLGKNKEALKYIEVIFKYFQIAKAQKWTKEVNFVILEREYSELIKQIRDFGSRKKSTRKIRKKTDKAKTGLNSRQKKILNYIEKEKTVRGADIVNRFLEAKPRTIRNDLNILVDSGFLTFKKEGRNCFYKK